MRRLIALVLAVGSIIAVAPAAAANAATGAAVGAAPPSSVVWGSCPPPEGGQTRDPRLQCAVLAVPLDYRHPGGRSIDITISRLAVSKPGVRRGILLSNPGGPGGPGLDLPGVLARVLPAPVLDRYDLIGFDPRGIGYSTPVTCGLNTNQPDLPTLVLPYPSPDGSIARNVEFARNTAAGCASHSGDLLPFITTANTARDMDRIRAALGEPKLSYFGISYGTYLGGVYTSLFPQRSDRIILDSSVDPNLVWYEMWRTWNSAVAIRFPDFATWAAARDATYHLGATPEAVRDTYFRLVDGLDRRPVPLPSGFTLDGNLLREVTRTALYADAAFPGLALNWQTVAQLVQAPGNPASLTATLDRTLGATGVAASIVPPDNQFAALYSVVCDDASWPRILPLYAINVAIDRRIWPLTNGMPSNTWPCAFWPNRPIEPPVSVTDHGPRDVLMLQNTRDPATSLRSGLGMRAALGRRATMVTVDQGGHGVYTLGSCADQIANDYLASGTLPSTDRFCPAPPQPNGTTPHSLITPTGIGAG